MNRRSMVLAVLLLVTLALPLSASQFVRLPFDDVARQATYVVRGTLGQTWSAWDDAHEVIYTYATVRVQRYFGETTGPDTLIVREAGGTVDGYTQEAIGFPILREGEEVVLMLSQWEGSADYRIHAFNQGKYLVKNRGGIDVLTEDPVKQGDARLTRPRFEAKTEAIPADALTMREFAQMVEDARAGRPVERPRQ
jgi:hypothetical protein